MQNNVHDYFTVIEMDDIARWIESAFLPSHPDNVISPITGYRWRFVWPKS